MADITWVTTSLPVAYAGTPYEAGLAETGAVTAVTACTVASGSLPPGITVSADKKRLTGTPTALGTYTFTLTMTDTAGSVTSPSLSIKVQAAGSHDDIRSSNVTMPVAAQIISMWGHL